jgi:hypothetical protein
MKAILFSTIFTIVSILFYDCVHAQVKTKIYYEGITNENKINPEIHSKSIPILLKAEKEQTDIFKEVQSFQSIGIVPVNTLLQKNEIEINPFLRYDNYPKFSSQYSERNSTDYLRMQGISYGVAISYKHFLKNNLFIKAGLGYYNYRFDELNNINSLWQVKTSSRTISYNSPLFITYATDRYHYNNLLVRLGIGKEFYLNKETHLITDLSVMPYYSFSQYYHLTSNPWDGNLNFHKNRAMLFGFSSTISIAITKQYKNFQIGPSLIIPVFDLWKKDLVFLEGNGYRDKWVNGIGVGIVCNIFLLKK